MFNDTLDAALKSLEALELDVTKAKWRLLTGAFQIESEKAKWIIVLESALKHLRESSRKKFRITMLQSFLERQVHPYA
jgi:hypothetical protein